MDNGKDISLPVKEFFSSLKNILKLKTCLGSLGFEKNIKGGIRTKNKSFILLLGKGFQAKLNKLSQDQKRKAVRGEIKKETCCVILADGIKPFRVLEEVVREKEAALFLSTLSLPRCRKILNETFHSVEPKEKIVSGGLLKIYEQGVMITGDSGIGKSESALELLSRGHYFISDDVVKVSVDSRGSLIGRAPEVIQNSMEIRGLGIINIKEIFGPNKICTRAHIDLVILLKKWRQGQEYDRLGLKFPEDHQIHYER